METIKTFIEGIKAKDIADIFISIAILVIFFVLSIWLPRLLLKIWKVNEKDKKVLKENDTYKGLRSIFLCFGIYLALIILALPYNIFFVKSMYPFVLLGYLERKFNLIPKIYKNRYSIPILIIYICTIFFYKGEYTN